MVFFFTTAQTSPIAVIRYNKHIEGETEGKNTGVFMPTTLARSFRLPAMRTSATLLQLGHTNDKIFVFFTRSEGFVISVTATNIAAIVDAGGTWLPANHT